jgi:alpha-methylacyl-CoA racemase
MALQVDEHLATGAEPGPGSSMLTGRYACYGVYRAADGGWVTVAAIEPRFWANLCVALGLERWREHQTDDDVQDEIRADLRAAFAARDRDDWVARLAPADTCVAPVLSVTELVADEQFAARGAFTDAEHPRHGRFRQLAPTLAGTRRPDDRAVLRDAELTDTDALLDAAGVDAGARADMRAAGVIA